MLEEEWEGGRRTSGGNRVARARELCGSGAGREGPVKGSDVVPGHWACEVAEVVPNAGGLLSSFRFGSDGVASLENLSVC